MTQQDKDKSLDSKLLKLLEFENNHYQQRLLTLKNKIHTYLVKENLKIRLISYKI